jgi:hypothetical protein
MNPDIPDIDLGFLFRDDPEPSAPPPPLSPIGAGLDDLPAPDPLDVPREVPVEPVADIPPVAPIPEPVPNPCAEEKDVLRGTGITDTDIEEMMSFASKQNVRREQVIVTKKVVEYKSDRRIISFRNVKEVAEDFEAVQLTYVPCFPVSYVVKIALAFIISLIPSCFDIAYARYFSLTCAVVCTHCCIQYFRRRILQPCSYWTLLFHPSRFRKWRTYNIPFAPHLVTALMLEYDRGTNAVAAVSTIRARLRQMAAFPLPDFDALAYYQGTETVALHLLHKSDFYTAGVTFE